MNFIKIILLFSFLIKRTLSASVVHHHHNHLNIKQSSLSDPNEDFYLKNRFVSEPVRVQEEILKKKKSK